MTKLLPVLALLAGFVIAAPVTPDTAAEVAAFSATVDAAHLPGTATTRATTHPVQQGHQGQPLDGVQPPVHVTPRALPATDVEDPSHRTPERSDRTPLGERAPPATSGS